MVEPGVLGSELGEVAVGGGSPSPATSWISFAKMARSLARSWLSLQSKREANYQWTPERWRRAADGSRALTWRSQRCEWTSSGTGRCRSGPRPPRFPGRQTWFCWRLSSGCAVIGQRSLNGRIALLWRSQCLCRILPQRKTRSLSPSVCDATLKNNQQKASTVYLLGWLNSMA